MKVTVQTGDTLVKIAGRFGTTAGAILAVNPDIENAALIFPGQILLLPEGIGGDADTPQPAVAVGFQATYRVRSGDSLRKIAAHFGCTIADLLANNPQIADPAILHVGVELKVPGTATTDDTVPATAPATLHGLPPWLAIAKREMDTGVEEIKGAKDNPRIIEYHASTTLKASDDETPWCSSFVNWCLHQAGFRGTNSAAARSWLNWKDGITLDTPRKGAVVIFERPPSHTSGHVAFFWDSSGNHINVLGGNQSNQVSIKGYEKSRLLGFRWPKGFPLD